MVLRRLGGLGQRESPRPDSSEDYLAMGHPSLGDITLEDTHAGALTSLLITVFLPAPLSVAGPEALREERGLSGHSEPVKRSALIVVS